MLSIKITRNTRSNLVNKINTLRNGPSTNMFSQRSPFIKHPEVVDHLKNQVDGTQVSDFKYSINL